MPRWCSGPPPRPPSIPRRAGSKGHGRAGRRAEPGSALLALRERAGSSGPAAWCCWCGIIGFKQGVSVPLTCRPPPAPGERAGAGGMAPCCAAASGRFGTAIGEVGSQRQWTGLFRGDHRSSYVGPVVTFLTRNWATPAIKCRRIKKSRFPQSAAAVIAPPSMAPDPSSCLQRLLAAGRAAMGVVESPG